MGDRDSLGQFAEGNQCAAGSRGGRARRATEEKYLASLLKVVTPDEWQKVIAKLLEKAKKGDLSAIKMICEYAIGKPQAYVKTDVDVSVGNVNRFFSDALNRAYGD